MRMKNKMLMVACAATLCGWAVDVVKSPDGRLELRFSDEGGRLEWSLRHNFRRGLESASDQPAEQAEVDCPTEPDEKFPAVHFHCCTSFRRSRHTMEVLSRKIISPPANAIGPQESAPGRIL